jgi:hypothetical protein
MNWTELTRKLPRQYLPVKSLDDHSEAVGHRFFNSLNVDMYSNYLDLDLLVPDKQIFSSESGRDNKENPPSWTCGCRNLV